MSSSTYKMSYPSQVCMSELQQFMTPSFIINAFQKLGHHPINATITKKRKGDNKEVCIIQFANEDAAKQAVFKLNGKPIPSSGFNSAKFKLSQCIGSKTAEHNVWVGDLTLDVDDYHFFKFFSTHYKTLCNAKVIVDTRGVSKGYGFLRFSCEDEQKSCLKTKGGSLGLGCRPIRVGPVTKGYTVSGHGGPYEADGEVIPSEEDTASKDKDRSWNIYTSWNRLNEPKQYVFAATKSKTIAKDDVESNQDLKLIDYNFPVSVDDFNREAIEKDCYLWDALECTKWLPQFALSTVNLKI